ncbi:MAG: hypothetical protein CFH30_00621 [Alphaproteobacteria bacterium MarineAlpha8_Bin1]|nr:MAG: hypothetical protein CFH30_00621 [Alphaproteobacteria bacterium MarineAlpha8_Bin1]
MNKSFITNLLSLILTIYGLYSPIYSAEIFMAGLFALSGGITNWIAIHMLFEKIPFLYGSGIIPQRFEEFKLGIKELILAEFFSKESLESFIKENLNEKQNSILDNINHDYIFTKLIEAIKESSLGSFVDLVGGEKSLQPLKEPIRKKIQEIFDDIKKNEEEKIGDHNHDIFNNLEKIIDKRLDELTPNQVKDIIKNIIEKHLGWLVVWGGIFGFIIGTSLGLIGRIG